MSSSDNCLEGPCQGISGLENQLGSTKNSESQGPSGLSISGPNGLPSTKVTVLCLSFVSLLKHQSRQSQANIRILSTFFIGSSVVVIDYCPPSGDPEDDKNIIYGKSPNLNKIQYYQETIK